MQIHRLNFKYFSMIFLFGILTPFILQAQATVITWRNPMSEKFNIVQGQGWPVELAGKYQRLPDRAKKTVRPPVWALADNSAGEYIEFESNAKTIVVRYSVTGSLSMPHMPATGVSGLDLFAKSKDGQWEWAPGKFSFKDTIRYRFENLKVDSIKIFRLYLPLYNSVKWLEVGTVANTIFRFLPPEHSRPIVVYGTSIAQGGCASRPGLAWTAILGRDLNLPIVNLGFSGNGNLEQSVVDLISELDAKLYILDCMPNLSSKVLFPDSVVEQRIFAAIATLRLAHPRVPIALAQHSGGNSDLIIETEYTKEFRRVSTISKSTFDQLRAQGKKNIYLLRTKAIGMGINSTVDGAHPNDIGMMEYAKAYEKIIRKILRKNNTNDLY